MRMPQCESCRFGAEWCERREEIKAAVRGHGVHSVKFKCERRFAMLERGRRVDVRLGGHFDDGDVQEGTIMGLRRDGKVRVWLDELSYYNRRIVVVWPKALVPLPECVPCCARCGRPLEGAKTVPRGTGDLDSDLDLAPPGGTPKGERYWHCECVPESEYDNSPLDDHPF